MAFDFNGPNRGSTGRTEQKVGGFQFPKQPGPSGPQNGKFGTGRPSSGFQGVPKWEQKDKAPARTPNLPDSPRSYPKTPQPYRPASGGMDMSSLPWKWILLALLAVAGVILVAVFWEEICSFFFRLLAWAVVILVIGFLFKFLFAPRRRW